MKLVFALLLTTCGISCAGAPPRPAKHTITTLPPIHVMAEPSPTDISADAYDAETLFSRASNAQEQGDCELAMKWYRKLELEFPTSTTLEPAYYNMGLCLDRLGRQSEAVIVYRALLNQFPDSPERKNGYFRLAASLEELEAWPEMIDALTKLEAEPSPLPALDQVEVYAKKGAALIELGQPNQARNDLENAIRVYTRDQQISDTAPDYYYSMAQFKLAEITHQEMRQVTLPPGDKELATILEKKCQLLLDSQYLYTKVIRIGHPHWSAAAAYRTGALYRHLWEDMLAAPAPEGLTNEEQGIYMEILRKRIKILLQKAVKQWRRTIKFADRLKLDNAWVEQTQADLKEIEAALEIEQTVGADLPVN